VTYVLDTTTLSALMRANPSAIARLRGLLRTEVLLPQPAVAEVSYGLRRMQPSRRRVALRARFDLFRHELRRVVWDDAVSAAFGDIKASLERRGERLEDFDVAIAAHAVAARATLVTSNVRHMRRVEGLLLQDWTAATSR
jgi:tRNA(fMet)-specific endonuclease VapC